MGAAQKDDRYLRGRQIAFLIYEYLRVTRTHKAALDFSELFSITLRADDVQGFDTRWDEVLLSTREVAWDAILESLCKMQIRESDHFKTVLALCEQDIEQKNTQPNYHKLKTTVKKFLDQKMRARPFEANRHKNTGKKHKRREISQR